MHTTSSGIHIPDSYDMRGYSLGRASDRGTNTEGDVLTQTVDGRDLNEVWNEIQATLSAWNEGRTKLVSALTFGVTQPIEDVPQIALGDFEEASEFGEPVGIRGGDFFSMGYTFKWYDVAVRYTWKYLAEASAAQVETLHNQVMEADNRLIFQKVLSAIFNNVTRVANIRGQNYNVYPFYNGDGVVPPSYKFNTFSGSETHYMVSGAATVDATDLMDLYAKLSKKGYGKDNGSTNILLVNSAELATIRTFRVSTGAPYDFIAASGGAPWLLPTNTGGVVTPQGSAIPSVVNGLAVAGGFGPWVIVEEDYIPAGYMLGFATGGELNAQNPVGIREHANAGLRGLRLVKGRDNDYPLVDSFYNRGFGTGVRHRGAGAVMQIKASGSYAVPAAYNAVG